MRSVIVLASGLFLGAALGARLVHALVPRPQPQVVSPPTCDHRELEQALAQAREAERRAAEALAEANASVEAVAGQAATWPPGLDPVAVQARVEQAVGALAEAEGAEVLDLDCAEHPCVATLILSKPSSGAGLEGFTTEELHATVVGERVAASLVWVLAPHTQPLGASAQRRLSFRMLAAKEAALRWLEP